MSSIRPTQRPVQPSGSIRTKDAFPTAVSVANDIVKLAHGDPTPKVLAARLAASRLPTPEKKMIKDMLKGLLQNSPGAGTVSEDVAIYAAGRLDGLDPANRGKVTAAELRKLPGTSAADKRIDRAAVDLFEYVQSREKLRPSSPR